MVLHQRKNSRELGSGDIYIHLSTQNPSVSLSLYKPFNFLYFTCQCIDIKGIISYLLILNYTCWFMSYHELTCVSVICYIIYYYR